MDLITAGWRSLRNNQELQQTKPSAESRNKSGKHGQHNTSTMPVSAQTQELHGWLHCAKKGHVRSWSDSVTLHLCKKGMSDLSLLATEVGCPLLLSTSTAMEESHTMTPELHSLP